MSVYYGTNMNRPGWPAFCEINRKIRPLKIVGRNDFLFSAAAAAIVAGLLLNFSSSIIDVLLIFSLCLTITTVIITFSAQTAIQMPGLPLLVVLTAMLHMTVTTASAKLMVSDGQASLIVGFLANLFAGTNRILMGLVISGLMIFSFGVICNSVRTISRTAANFIADITAVKKISIDRNVEHLEGENIYEAGFLFAMSGTGKFVLCAVVIELGIFIFNLIASIFAGVTGKNSHFSHETNIALAASLALTIQLSSLLIIIASKHIVLKSSAFVRDNNGISQEEFEHKIKVISSKVTNSQSRISKKDTVSSDKTEHLRIVHDETVVQDLHWYADDLDNLNMCFWEDIKDKEDFDAIAELIDGESSENAKIILIASDNIEQLKVTVPVNIAMHLAQKGQKCLLIDLDLQRGAVLKAFDIDTNDHTDTAIETCINNIHVWATEPAKNNNIDLKAIIKAAETEYDRLIVYAPNIALVKDRENLSENIQAAMLFNSNDTCETSEIIDLYRLLRSEGCKILKPFEALEGIM